MKNNSNWVHPSEFWKLYNLNYSNEKASTNCSSCSLCPPCGALFDWNSINISWTSCYEPTSSSLLALVLLDWLPSAKWSLGLSLSHYVFTRIPRLPPSQVSFDYLIRSTLSGVFYNVKNGSSFITSNNLPDNLSTQIFQ